MNIAVKNYKNSTPKERTGTKEFYVNKESAITERKK
jgi:hypothetical protein